MWLFHKLKRPYQHRNKAGATSALRRSSVLGDFFSTLNSVIMNHKISYFLRKEKKTTPTWALNCFPMLHGKLKASTRVVTTRWPCRSTKPRTRSPVTPPRRVRGRQALRGAGSAVPTCFSCHAVRQRINSEVFRKTSPAILPAWQRDAQRPREGPCWTGGDAETPRQC